MERLNPTLFLLKCFTGQSKLLIQMATDSSRASNPKTSRWGNCAVPELPEDYFILDARLRDLPNNPIVRLYVFKSTNPPIAPLASPNGVRPKPPQQFHMLWDMLIEICVMVGIIIGMFWVENGVGLRTIYGCLFLAVVAPLLIWIGIRAYRRSNAYFYFMQQNWAELRILPITDSDFALAHWGIRLIFDSDSQCYPATALWHCCTEIERRLKRQKGVTISTRTYNLHMGDAVERGSAKVVDGEGHPTIKDQFRLTSDTFNYANRLRYLAALWGDYKQTYLDIEK